MEIWKWSLKLQLGTGKRIAFYGGSIIEHPGMAHKMVMVALKRGFGTCCTQRQRE